MPKAWLLCIRDRVLGITLPSKRIHRGLLRLKTVSQPGGIWWRVSYQWFKDRVADKIRVCAGSQVVSLLILWASLVTPSRCLFLNFFGHTWCRILVLRPEIKLSAPALEVWSLNHWATKEVLLPLILPQVISWLLLPWWAIVRICPRNLGKVVEAGVLL